MDDQRLAGQAAIVAGATRGAGRGIPRALAEAGALVYCTGRSVVGLEHLGSDVGPSEVPA